MNINDPTTSRILAILIRNLEGDEWARFREDAAKAKNIDEFIKGMGKYKTVEE